MQIGRRKGRAGVGRPAIFEWAIVGGDGNFDGLEDGGDEFVWLVGHCAVGKAQHPEALGPEPGVAGRVLLRIVKGSVCFDDQAMPQAEEVDDISAEGDLAAEFQMLKAAIAEEVPEDLLVEDRRFAHSPGHGEFGRWVRHLASNKT